MRWIENHDYREQQKRHQNKALRNLDQPSYRAHHNRILSHKMISPYFG